MSYGITPRLASYTVFASPDAVLTVELVNANGETMSVGNVTVTATSVTLVSLLAAALRPLEGAVGALVRSASGPVFFNTSRGSVAASAAMLQSWQGGVVYRIGAVD